MDFDPAAADINPDSRPVPERWILTPLQLTFHVEQPGQPTCAGTVDFDPAAADINPDSRPQMFHVELFVLLYLTFHFSMIVNSFN